MDCPFVRRLRHRIVYHFRSPLVRPRCLCLHSNITPIKSLCRPKSIPIRTLARAHHVISHCSDLQLKNEMWLQINMYIIGHWLKVQPIGGAKRKSVFDLSLCIFKYCLNYSYIIGGLRGGGGGVDKSSRTLPVFWQRVSRQTKVAPKTLAKVNFIWLQLFQLG